MENQNLDLDQKVHQESGQVLLDILRGEDIGKVQARAAMTAYNGSTRAISTGRVKEAMQYSIVKDLAKDKKQLEEYVKATLPNFVPEKLLTE